MNARCNRILDLARDRIANVRAGVAADSDLHDNAVYHMMELPREKLLISPEV